MDVQGQIVSVRAREVVRRRSNDFKLDLHVTDLLIRLVARHVLIREIRFPASEVPQSLSHQAQFLNSHTLNSHTWSNSCESYEEWLPVLDGTIFDDRRRRRYMYLPMKFWPNLNVTLPDVRIDCSSMQAQLILENLSKKHRLRWAFDAFKEAVSESIQPGGRLYLRAMQRCKQEGMR